VEPGPLSVRSPYKTSVHLNGPDSIAMQCSTTSLVRAIELHRSIRTSDKLVHCGEYLLCPERDRLLKSICGSADNRDNVAHVPMREDRGSLPPIRHDLLYQLISESASRLTAAVIAQRCRNQHPGPLEKGLWVIATALELTLQIYLPRAANPQL